MGNLAWNEFVENVQQWAEARGIYEHSTPQVQLMKALSEIGEVADAVIKNDQGALADGIGDVAVCFVNYSTMCDPSLLSVDFIDQADASFPNNNVSKESLIGVMASNVGYAFHPHFPIESSRDISLYALTALVGLSLTSNLDFMECCTRAWNEIKDRTGRMVEGGAFVKDE